MRNVSSRPPVAVYGRTPFPFGGKALFLLTLCLFLSTGAAAQRRAARIKAESIAATYAGRVQAALISISTRQRTISATSPARAVIWCVSSNS